MGSPYQKLPPALKLFPTNSVPGSAAPRRRGYLPLGLTRVLRPLWLGLLILLVPGASAALAQDRLFEPVHVAATSAESAEMTVDLSDPNKFPLSSTGKWTGYLEFLGKPGTERSLGQPDLFLPLLQDKNDMTFFNLRGQLQFDNTDVSEYNIGLGHRHMFQEWILGGYGYFDHRNTQLNNAYRQFTGGLELMSVDWAFRMNGYLPENKTETSTSGANVSVIRPGDQINVQVDGLVQEKALSGLDGEVGYLLPIPWKAYTAVFDETRVYAGGYHFLGEDGFESVTGPRGRVEWRAYDLPVLGPGSRFMMGVEAQWDEPRGSQAFGLASLRIPFDVFSDKSTRKPLTGLDRRMLQPVIRDVDVVTSTRDHTETLPALNLDGQAYTKAVDVALEGLTDTEKETAIEAVLEEHEGEVLAIIVDGDPMTTTDMGDGDWRDIVKINNLELGPNHTLSSAGKELMLNYVSPTIGSGSIGYTPSGTLVGIDGNINMGSGSQVNGMRVDATGRGNGIRIQEVGNHYITDSIVEHARNRGVYVRRGATAYINDSHISHITGTFSGTGVEVSDAIAFITNSTVEDVHNRGVLVHNGATAYISDSHISSAFVGVEVSGARAVISNSQIFDNLRGIDIIDSEDITILNSHIFNGRGSGSEGINVENPKDITISNSHIYNNDTGIDVLSSENITISKSEMSGNGRGIDITGGSLTLSESTVSGNGHGVGGVVGRGSAEITISKSKILDYWRGIDINDSNLTLTESTVSGTDADIGVFGDNSADITIEKSEISDNLFGVLVQNSSLTLTESTVTDNTWFGVLGSNSEITIEKNSRIFDNGVAGIWAENASTLDIFDSSIYDNIRAGVYLKTGSTLTIIGSSIYGNGHSGLAATGSSIIKANNMTITGNGIYGVLSAGGDITVTNSVVVDNTVADYKNLTSETSKNRWDDPWSGCRTLGSTGSLKLDDDSEIPATDGDCVFP